MRLKLEIEGGFASFPGLRTPGEIDTEGMPDEEAAEILRRVEEAHFFERPEGPEEPPPGAADLRLYGVTVEDGARRHTVRVYEPVADPALRALISSLEARAKALRRGGRRTGGAEGEWR